jgi:hypothetical protein
MDVVDLAGRAPIGVWNESVEILRLVSEKGRFSFLVIVFAFRFAWSKKREGMV